MYSDSNMSPKHETFWTGLLKQLCLSDGVPSFSLGGGWILSLKYLICRICPQRWTITVEAWEGPKAWWTNEENVVCVGYFVSVTPGVTLQSIQCQSNCEDKTGRANQCSGPLKQPRAMKEPLYSTGRAPLMRNYSHACEPRLRGDQSISCWWALLWFPNQIMSFSMPMDLWPVWRWYYPSGWWCLTTHTVGAVGELLTVAFHREWFGCPCKSSSLLWD